MAPRTREPETKLLEAGLLLDAYGGLLTERQRDFMRLHFELDLSFSEIAREFNISRQAVHDSVKHAIQALHHFEEALGLVAAEKRRATAGEQVGGRQLLGRLEKMRLRLQREDKPASCAWLRQELDDLIHLLGGNGRV